MGRINSTNHACNFPTRMIQSFASSFRLAKVGAGGCWETACFKIYSHERVCSFLENVKKKNDKAHLSTHDDRKGFELPFKTRHRMVSMPSISRLIERIIVNNFRFESGS